MENKTDSSFERSIIFRVVAIIVCIIIAGSSFFGLAKSYSSPESKINKETIKYLDEKKTNCIGAERKCYSSFNTYYISAGR